MVTYYNTKDMVLFANWLMKRIKTGEKKPDPKGDFEVTRADFEHWKHFMENKEDQYI